MLATTAACYLNQTGGGHLVSTLTLGVTVLNQTHAGRAAAMSPVTTKAAIRSSARKGYLDGAALAKCSAWLRPTDLVWRYWVNNYIEGRQPPPFDVLFWNTDAAPACTAGLHHDMVRTGIENGFTVAGGVEVAGVGINLSKLEQDIYIMAGITDHISPWQACYRSARLFPDAPTTFVLSSSGHMATLVNTSHQFQAVLLQRRTDPSDTRGMDGGNDQTGRLVVATLVDWLAQRSGGKTPAPQAPGSAHYPPLGAAPGEYVLDR